MRLASAARIVAPSIFGQLGQPLGAVGGVEQEPARADVEHLGAVAHDDERAHAGLEDPVEPVAQRRARRHQGERVQQGGAAPGSHGLIVLGTSCRSTPGRG